MNAEEIRQGERDDRNAEERERGRGKRVKGLKEPKGPQKGLDITIGEGNPESLDIFLHERSLLKVGDHRIVQNLAFVAQKLANLRLHLLVSHCGGDLQAAFHWDCEGDERRKKENKKRKSVQFKEEEEKRVKMKRVYAPLE